VVCIPREEAESVLAASRAQLDKEAGIQAAIAGAGWDRAWVDEILKAKGCEGV
jgi:regulator of RNase E activity RraA